MTSTYYSSPYRFTESREKRISRVQAMRLRLAVLLTVCSLIELAVVCMGYYNVEVPYWLMVASVVCVLFNIILIMWLLSLWNERRRSEKEIRKQANNRR